MGVLSNRLLCSCSSHTVSEDSDGPTWNIFRRSIKTEGAREVKSLVLLISQTILRSKPMPLWDGRSNLCKSLCSTRTWCCWVQQAPSPQEQHIAGRPIITSLHRTCSKISQVSGYPQTLRTLRKEMSWSSPHFRKEALTLNLVWFQHWTIVKTFLLIVVCVCTWVCACLYRGTDLDDLTWSSQ